jgi:DNA (cytosine-5)-methyltransferase 1
MTFYEFFAGAGTARLGLGTGWTCTFADDIDPAKMCSYVANFGAQGAMTRDVARLTVADLLGVVSLAWASFPCQDVSLAGDRAGLDGARSSTFWSFWRLMQALRAEGRAPKLIVIENVCGLLTSHGGKDFDAICGALAACDYRFGAVKIDAALFVPQSRPRLFIVAVDANTQIPAELTTGIPIAPFYPSALVAACSRQRSAPIWFRLPIPPQRNTTFADIIEDEPTGVTWHTQAATDRLLGMMAPLHLAKVEAAKRTGERMIGALYRRIRPDDAGGKIQRAEVRFDDLAGCLRMPTGGSSRQTIVIVDGDTVRSRLLSPREAARLMGIGDEYVLPENYNEAYGLMADGVCVPAVRFLAQHVLEPVVRAQRDAAKPIAAQWADDQRRRENPWMRIVSRRP